MKRDCGREYYIFNVYTAVGHNRKEYEAQFRIIEKFIQDNNLRQQRNFIVAGDINLNLLDPSAHPQHYSNFKSFLRELNLFDAAAKANFQNVPTWRGFGERAGSKSRIDVFLCSKENPEFNFVNYKVHPSSSSDHVILSIGLTESRIRTDKPSNLRTISWKDSIITSRRFKTEAQETLIDLLSQKVIDPTKIDLARFNDDKISLHKKLEILDKPDNIELKENDLTYLLPLILKDGKLFMITFLRNFLRSQ